MTSSVRTTGDGGGTAEGMVERLGIRVRGAGSAVDPPTVDCAALLGIAVRRNPRRAQLLVSRVLGKHVPTDPRLVRAVGLLLGGLVADTLAGRRSRPLPVHALHAAVRGDRAAIATLHAVAVRAVERARDAPDALVLGYAETATALGHCVAEGLGGADYLHSTRRLVAGSATAGVFAEEHSHAVDHLLLPADPALLRGGRPLVLVDDELSTGRTALNTITALHRTAPRPRYVVAALVDVREPGGELEEGGRALGAKLDVVALARGRVDLPADLTERAATLRAEVDGRPDRADVPAPAGETDGPRGVGRVELRGCGWPAGLPAGGRHGFTGAHHRTLGAALPELAVGLARAAGIVPRERTLVLGTEELMALPLRLAEALASTGNEVAFSTTTRSPAVVVPVAGYALTSGISFPAHDDPADGPGPRHAYNLGGPADPPWDHVLVVVDPPADTALLRTGLLAALAPRARRTTVVVTP